MKSGKNSKPRVEDVNQGSLTTASDTACAENFGTYGLHVLWQPHFNGAVAAGLTWEFLFLLDVTLSKRLPSFFGTLISELTNRVSFECLRIWAKDEPLALTALKLARAVLRGDDFGFHHRYTQERSARQQLGNSLERDYLLALIVQPTQLLSDEDREWIQVLRVWTLVHALKRALRVGQNTVVNVQDKLLRELATGIRLACDRDFKRRGLLAEIKTTERDFNELNSHLSRRCTDILKDKARQPLSQTSRQFLNAIRDVAQLQENPDEQVFSNSGTPVFLSGMLPTGGMNLQLPAKPLAVGSVGGDDADKPPATILGGDDETDGVYAVDVDPAAPYQIQRLKLGSVLLLAGEEYHHLPWSWGRPNPFEAAELKRLIDDLLVATDAKHRLIGAYLWMASASGRTLRRLFDIEVGRQPSVEWRLHPTALVLHRLPPMRPGGWLPEEELERQWVAPVAELCSIALPPNVVAVLTHLISGAEEGDALGTLWSWPEAPESVLRSVLPSILKRVTPGMMGRLLPQHIFESTGDAAFALLASSHPASGMPASCAYASWPVDYVNAALNGTSSPDLRDRQVAPIGAGSRLDVIEGMLVSALGQAYEKVTHLTNGTDPIAFHNAFVGYLVLALLAGSGVRPIRDPFESPNHFNFDEGFGYIDDKASDEVHQGRLVLLPTDLCRFIATEYLRHLELLADGMDASDPSMAANIRMLAKRCGNVGMPFFFMLDKDSPERWASVSESSIDMLQLFDCPLSLRLFRHRFSIRLRRDGMDPEIIDSMLGHSDAGGATHGDDSLRVWKEDIETCRSIFECMYAKLQIQLPKSWEVAPVISFGSDSDGRWSQAPQSRMFGAAERKRQREVRAVEVSQVTEATIQEYLDSLQLNGLEELDEEQVIALAQRLLFNEKGLPRPTGMARYELLMGKLDALWLEQAKRLRIKRRFTRWRPPPSAFRPESCRAESLLDALKGELGRILEGRETSTLRIHECVALATTRLCVFQRITTLAVIKDVCIRKNFRLVSMKGLIYFEHGLRLDDYDADAAVRRHRIDKMTALLLDRWLDAGRTVEVWDKPIEKAVMPLAQGLLERQQINAGDITHGDFIKSLCRIVDQVNVMNLPGLLAGHLAGRVASYALSWRDWVRIEMGRPAIFRDDDVGNGNPGTADDLLDAERFDGIAPIARDKPFESEAAQVAANEFFVAMRVELSRAKQKAKANSSSKRRKTLKDALSKVVREWNGKVSTAVLLLGNWLSSQVYKQGRKSEYRAVSSIERYFTGLSPSFLEVAANVDLLALDEDEVTHFYLQLLDCRSNEDSTYVAERLSDFHQWARNQGVNDPDWSEMPETMRGRKVAPGFITEREYRDALTFLFRDEQVSQEISCGSAFLLLCCYRFGLRDGEALGLFREDFWRHNDEVVIFVRDRLTDLKTKRSQRQVPMLFRLSRLELSIVDKWFTKVLATIGDKTKEPLYGDAARARKTSALQPYIRPVIDVLKRVTGNPRMILHHARHTAANRIAMHFFELKWPALRRAVRNGDIRVDHDDLVRMLLGREGPTRRSSWAMSRYTGHVGSGTFYRSYVHLLGVWIDELIGVKYKDEGLTLRHSIALDRLPPMVLLKSKLPANTEPPSALVTMPMIMKFFRLLGRRYPCKEAALALGIPLAFADRLCAALDDIGAKMILSKTSEAGGQDATDARAFLRRIQETAWDRLLRWANSLSTPKIPQGVRKKGKCNAMGFTCSLDDVVRIVSPRRQLVMWKSEHFSSVRALLDLAEINSKQYEVWQSAKCGSEDKVIRHAINNNFVLKKACEDGRQPLLDTARNLENDDLVQKRCCLLFAETAVGVVRNRYQLMLLLLAMAAMQMKVLEGGTST